jgi:hypothetical protein
MMMLQTRGAWVNQIPNGITSKLGAVDLDPSVQNMDHEDNIEVVSQEIVSHLAIKPTKLNYLVPTNKLEHNEIIKTQVQAGICRANHYIKEISL